MVIEFSFSWPFLRRHHCPGSTAHTATIKGAGAYWPPGHATWVVLNRTRKMGWLHHHEEDGWVIQHLDGTQTKAPGDAFSQTAAPEVPRG